MTYQEFKQLANEKIPELIKAHSNLDLTYQWDSHNTRGTEQEYLTCKAEGSKVFNVGFNFEQLYDSYQRSDNDAMSVLESFAYQIIDVYEQTPEQQIIPPTIEHKTEILNNLIPCLVPTREVTDDVLARDYLNLKLVYRCVASNTPDGVRTYVINKDIAEDLNLTEEDLYMYAMENLNREEYAPQIQTPYFPMQIVTNSVNLFGAACILDRTARQTICDIFHGDSILLPSSKHEMIILPDDGDPATYQEHLKMVEDVNLACVEDRDYLSTAVYKIDANTLEVSVVCEKEIEFHEEPDVEQNPGDDDLDP